MRQDVLKFRQHDEGLCGLYTIVNALSALYPEHMTHVKGAVLVSRLAEAVPGDMRSVIQEGTDRAQMDAMLAAARAWTDEQGWPAWTCRAMHPRHGEHAHPLWDAVAAELERKRPRKKRGRRAAAALPTPHPPQGAIALVGFGDYHRESTFYEPHWTCAIRTNTPASRAPRPGCGRRMAGRSRIATSSNGDSRRACGLRWAGSPRRRDHGRTFDEAHLPARRIHGRGSGPCALRHACRGAGEAGHAPPRERLRRED